MRQKCYILITPALLLCCSCGVSTGSGFVIGTTGFLQEFNRSVKPKNVPLENLSNRERNSLAVLADGGVK